MHPTHNTLTRGAFLGGFAALALAACGKQSNSTEAQQGASSLPATASTPASTQASTPVDGAGEAVAPAGLVGARTIHGNPYDPQALVGRPTVMWFWAPWCTVCRGEAPTVAAVADANAGRVNVIGIGGQGGASEMQGFVEQTGTGGFTHIDDGDTGAIWAQYEVFAQPAFAFITTDGRVETFMGALGESDLQEIIEQLLVA